MWCAEETIDLTTAGDSDIDRAVAESLRDVQGGGIFGGQVTQEEEQISKFVLFCHVFFYLEKVISYGNIFLGHRANWLCNC